MDLTLPYLITGVVMATWFWLASTRGWDPRTSGSVWGWLARRVLLTAVVGLLWPAALIILVLFLIPATRPWVSRAIYGPSDG
jgi:hypothetical protein